MSLIQLMFDKEFWILATILLCFLLLIKRCFSSTQSNTFYCGGDFIVEKGSTLYQCNYASKGLKTSQSSSFITKKIETPVIRSNIEN